MIILARQRAHRDALKASAGGRQLTRLELKEGIVQGGLERSSLCTLFFLSLLCEVEVNVSFPLK